MIKIFYTSPDYRNITASLFKEALKALRETLPQRNISSVNPDYSKILYLSPTFAKVREAQKIFFKLLSSSGCCVPPETATISELSRKIYSIYGDGRVLKKSLIPVVLSRLSGRGLGFSSLLADFIGNIKRRFPEKGVDEIRDIFARIFTECNIPDAVAKLPVDCLEIWDNYRSFMQRNGLVDEDDVLNACPGYVGSKGDGAGLFPGNTLLIIDGFYDLSSAEISLLNGLIRNSELTLLAAPSFFRTEMTEGFISSLKNNFDTDETSFSAGDRPADSNPTYYVYADPEAEVEGIARNIKSLYVSGRIRELERIAVALPALKKNAPMVERVFRRYGIPFDISLKRPIAARRPFLDLISLFLSVAEGYPRLRFAQFLSSPYFTKIPLPLREWIPMISLRSGIVSGKDAWLQMITEDPESDISSALGDDIERGLNWTFGRLKRLEDIGMMGTIDSFAEALKRLMDELGFLGLQEPAIGDEATAREEKKKFQEAIEQIKILGSIDPSGIGLSEFTEIMIHILQTIFLEEEGRGVKVLDMSESAGLCPEYLFAGGLTDEAMPGKPDIDYFLPDSVKKKLGFMHLDKYMDLRSFIFSNVVSSSTNLHLSCPLTDGDAQYLPSSFLYSAEGLKERIPGIFSKEEYLIRQGRLPLSSFISEISASDVRFQQYLRVTDIDAYRYCPRKFFIERVAKVTPLEIREYEVEAITLGSILHRIMEKIMLAPLKDLDALRERAVKIADEVLGEKKMNAYWKELIKDTFLSILPDIYEMEFDIRTEGYVSSTVEKTISGEPVKGIKLKGKIDRFDNFGDSVQIIDYKSGSASMNCSQVARGKENLQLFLYAAIMKNQGYNVERVGLYSLKDIQIKWCPPRKKCRGRERENIDDYIIESLKYLEEAVNGMRRGDFTARPLNEYNCRNCHEYSLCPYIQQ